MQVAIAAKYALLHHGETASAEGCGPVIRRVAIIDWDLHHGNGTEEIVGAWDEVFYASLHGSEQDAETGEFFYPGTGGALESSERPHA
jgi:acetoin utilization deacetylase AcuC-like enzyme